MTDTRQQDPVQHAAPARSDRIYSEQDVWYFRTREGEAVGPFRYRSEAQSNLEHFVNHLKEKLQRSG